jgi:hypothetical protein
MEDIPHDNNVEPWICADVGALESYGKNRFQPRPTGSPQPFTRMPKPLASRLVPLRGSDLAGSYYNRNDFLCRKKLDVKQQSR